MTTKPISKKQPKRPSRHAFGQKGAGSSHGGGSDDAGSANGRANGHARPAVSDEGGLDQRELLAALVAFKKGDFSVRLPMDLAGFDGKIADTFNDVVEQNQRMADELQRLKVSVGKEGRISQRASMGEVSGAWADCVDSVNSLVEDLAHPTQETARVIGAVARGDLTQAMAHDVEGRPLEGEFLRTAKIVNSMVSQLSSFASEVTRVAREVGTEGKLGGQANVPEVAGTWKDLTDSVNSMAGNLTSQVRNIAAVTTAVANGDLSKKISVDVRGEMLELKDTVNTMVDQLNSFASEVTRVAREVGTEGKLGGQANVQGVAGTWKDLTDNVNSMAGNLTSQVRNIAAVTTAVANGDLSKKITVDVKGEIAELKNTINTMVDQLRSFASEVTRVAREVGTEGKLGGQANVPGVAGTWKDLTDNVNSMAGNLTSQVRNIAAVTTAVANGDLSKTITVDVKGEIAELKGTINTMVDQLSSFADEVTRVAREVGTEGKLGGQARVPGVAGTWKDLTDNVNSMAGNLTVQLRDVSKVATAIADGDLTQKITVDASGEILQIKNVINTMVDQLSSFAAEVTRVAREVGTEGKLGGQAYVQGVAGTWKDLTDSVDSMARNLTAQVRDIAAVTTAVANGDLSKKITVDVEGEIAELKNTINMMVDQLSSFASEVTRVAREVGTEGKLGGQASVPGVAGTWKDLTDNVNSMAGNLTSQVRNIATVTTAVANGDLSKKITVDVKGEILELKDTINTMVDQLSSFAAEVTRVAREVGTEGKLGGQASVPGVAGTWKDLTDNVNSMAGNLTSQVRNIATVTTAVANGDLSKKITVDVKGEILELKDTINTMVDQLNAFASEVTRVAREVGTEGKLGGQASVPGVAGTWKDLTDNVNSMAGNLTNQVRDIATVVTSVANGDLKRKLTLDAKGEIAELADTINSMIETLATFADQVTTVARLVGVEGKLGGQARVPGAAGTWKDLTDNVNQLAANLTTQVRAIAEVATAVTKGDLTQSIKVEAQGEVAALKDNINEMIGNLKDTTHKNAEQDWLKTNLAKFSRMLQGQKDLLKVGKLILSELAPVVGAHQGVIYTVDNDDTQDATPRLRLLASYAHGEHTQLKHEFELGEGLIGQCAMEKQKILISDAPEGYIRIRSGLGEASPMNILVMPIAFEGQVKAVLELASFERFSPMHETFLDQLTESIAIVLNTIEADMRTENLLKQSQSLAQELQSRQEELQLTNGELEEKASLLAAQKTEVERKNLEVEQARQALEDKAKQLALTSKYKSEFLANMSHELRTPLNSLLILSDQLSKNQDRNLTARQVEFAQTIHAAGNDLLTLINDILDLCKIESGTVFVDVGELPLADLRSYVERTFRHVSELRNLTFEVEMADDLPETLRTDTKRLQQVIRNLLSNAFKFTEQGRVTLTVACADSGWNPDHQALNAAEQVIAFRVEDTGIGISPDKQQIIFEAFQQADGSTSRHYGGTGLGLAISREIADLLGGEIRLHSEPGRGSSFTLYLPDPPPAHLLKAHIDAEAAEADAGVKVIEAHSGEAGVAAQFTVDADEAAPETRREPVTDQEQPIVDDDRLELQADDRVLLVIERDQTLASQFVSSARQHGFKAVVVDTGAAALDLTRQIQPAAIVLDLDLPNMAGWRLLTHFKDNADTRHIPVQVVAAEEEDAQRGLGMGALGFLAMPPQAPEAIDEVCAGLRQMADPQFKNVLVVGYDEQRRQEIADLLCNEGVRIHPLALLDDARAALDACAADLIVLDPELESVFQLLDRIRDDRSLRHTPVIVYGPGDLDKVDEAELHQFGRSVVLKHVRSTERLLDEAVMFLHLPLQSLPENRRDMIASLHSTEAVFSGKRVLVVDDDVRNIFSMSSILEPYAIEVTAAENGLDAIDQLKQAGEMDLVLMDIMMPEMDGYDTIRAIRKLPLFRTLPIIALTAKAMKGDRDRCLEAGASDYIAKPVDSSQLLSMLRKWLHR